jgi:uncharacterized protein YrrD
MGEYRTIKDLTNKAVVSATNGQKIATVSDAMIDPATLSVAALMISGGTVFRPERQLIPAGAVQLWGQDVILVNGTDVIVRDLDMQRDDGWLQASDYLRRRSVVGTDGRRLGRVDDILLDEHGRFVGYQLAEVAVQGPLMQSRFIPATATQSLGRDVLLVDSSRLNGDGAGHDEAANLQDRPAAASPVEPAPVEQAGGPPEWSTQPPVEDPLALQVPMRQTGKETVELVDLDEPPPDPENPR